MGTETVNAIKTVKTNNIFFVGKMSYSPNEIGILWFIKNVYPYVKNVIPKVKLYVIGKDPSNELIQEGIKDKSIIVTGEVDSLDVYYNNTNLVISPIFNGGGVNVKLLEALGKGKIIITTTSGIEGTELINGKHLLIADSAVEFTKYCINCLENPNKY